MTPRSTRELILARRALFLGSAVSLLGCPPSGPSVPPPPTGTVAVPTASASTPEPAPTAEPTAKPTTTTGHKTWSEVMADAPPLAAPSASTIDAREREALAAVETDLRPRYEALGKLWDGAPLGCSLAKSGCTSQWLATLDALEEIGDASGSPLCGWSTDLPISSIQRRNAHSSFVQRAVAMLKGDLAATAAADGQTAAFEALQTGRVLMRPCLSCIAPAPRVWAEVKFAAGASTLDAGAEETLGRVKEVLDRDPRMRVQVRGHSDPGEPGDSMTLSKQRADTVRAALTKLGVAAGRLVTVAHGSSLPVEAPSRSAANRRVDFERVP